MIQRLLNFGIANDFFTILPIKDIEKSCCKISETEVIDFDETKRKVVSAMNESSWKMQEPKSCDALKIIPQVNRLDFIEFKGLETFIERLDKQGDIDGRISEQVKKFEFGTKIFDSFLILDYILKSVKFSMSRSERHSYKFVEKNYFIMVDIEIEENAIQDIAIALQFLSETSNIKQQLISFIQDEITGLGGEGGIIKINNPRLINKKDIDSYYSSLLSKAASQ